MLDDFCGFTFNGVHTSDLNIKRVSNGSRYNENLSAAFQDKMAQIEGGDGSLFWDSYYTNKPFSIQIAFDSVTETQLRRLRQVFCAKAMGEFIFDELPFKAYTAKVQTPPQLQYICFDDNTGNRVYKGEGTIQFIAYYPYAKSVHKFLNEFDDTFYNNKSQWSDASGMLPSRIVPPTTYDGTGAYINLYNAGDIETDWQAFYQMNNAGCDLRNITLNNSLDQRIGVIQLSPITEQKNENDVFLCLNSRTQLIEGCDSNKVPTGTLYNDYFSSGEFFKIPLGASSFISSGAESSTPCQEIKYTYLYY